MEHARTETPCDERRERVPTPSPPLRRRAPAPGMQRRRVGRARLSLHLASRRIDPKIGAWCVAAVCGISLWALGYAAIRLVLSWLF